MSHARSRMLVLAIGTVAGLFPAAASAAPPPVGGLASLPGATGCFATTATPGACQAANGIFAAESAVVSPDGRFVYAGSYEDGSNAGPGLAAFSRDPATGALTQLPGKAGCYTFDGSSQAGANTCTKVEGIGSGDGRDFAITSDGRWAYMVNVGPNSNSNVSGPPASIVIFQRDPATGALTQPAVPNGCVSQDGSGQDGANKCQTLATLGEPNGITLSSDNRYVYVADFTSGAGALHVLSRDTSTGALSEIQCLSDDTPAPAGCTTPGRSLGDVQSLVITPDGMHAYSAHYSNGVSVFDRDPATGMLTQKTLTAGCINDDGTGGCAHGRALRGAYALVVSPDGHTLYVAAQADNGFAILHINADGTLTQPAGTAGCVTLDGSDGTGLGHITCATGRGLDAGVYGDAISPDGRTLYVTEGQGSNIEGGVAIFSVDPATGAVSQLPGTTGCVTADGQSGGTPGACANGGPALLGAYTPNLSPDGHSLYVPAFSGEALTTFAVEQGPICRPTTVSTPYQTPVSIALSCTDADGDPVTRSIVAGPAHGTLGAVGPTVTYTPAAGYTGPESFTFSATDGTNTSPSVTATIAVAAPVAIGLPPASVSQIHQTHRVWRAGNHLASITTRRAPVGTVFSFILNETARVTLAFAHKQPGRVVGRRCVALTKRNQHKRKCTRTIANGTITFTGHAGTNRVAFQGRVNAHSKLNPGTYTVTITATAPTGASTPGRLTFTIVK